MTREAILTATRDSANNVTPTRNRKHSGYTQLRSQGEEWRSCSVRGGGGGGGRERGREGGREGEEGGSGEGREGEGGREEGG